MFLAENFKYITIILSIIIFITLFIYNKKIAVIFDIIDNPKKNKIHKISTPLTASFPILATFCILHIYYIFFFKIDFDIIIIFIFALVGFTIGIIDDRKNLNYLSKFSIFIFFITILVSTSENLLLERLYFETFNKIYLLNKFEAIFVTLLCVLLLINATNLTDGINGLCVGIATIWLVYVNYNFNLYMDYIPVIIICILSFIFIIRGNFFLGNSGSHLLGILIGVLVIYSYNINLNSQDTKNIISVEEIFILLMLPGIDMLRLFIMRIMRKKNPFSSDLFHLHHFLLFKTNLYFSLLIYFISMIIPLIVYNFFSLEAYLIVIAFSIYYLLLINYLSKSKIIN